MERGLSPSPEPSPYDSSGAEHDDAVEGVAGVEQTEAEAPTGMDEMACDVEQHQHVPPQQTEASPVSPLSEDGDFRQQEEQEEEEHEQEEEEKLQSPEEPAPPRSSSSLSQALLRDPLARLPQAGAEMVFGRCLAFLQRAMEDGECSEQVEGLFMLQPSLTDVRRLQRRILSGQSVGVMCVCEVRAWRLENGETRSIGGRAIPRLTFPNLSRL